MTITALYAKRPTFPWLTAFSIPICCTYHMPCILHVSFQLQLPRCHLLHQAPGSYSVIRSKPLPSKSKLLRCALCGLDRSISPGLVGFEVSKIGGLRGSYGPAIISFATCLADCCRLGTAVGNDQAFSSVRSSELVWLDSRPSLTRGTSLDRLGWQRRS